MVSRHWTCAVSSELGAAASAADHGMMLATPMASKLAAIDLRIPGWCVGARDWILTLLAFVILIILISLI